MSLKKPSELLDKKEVYGVFESPEVSSHITESYDKFRNNFERVNELSDKVEELSLQLSEKLSRTELENAMLSQLMVLDENFKVLQNEVKGLNKKDLKEFKETVYSLSNIVNNLVEIELPKYKKQFVKNEVFIGEKAQELQGALKEDIAEIREELDEKFVNIAEVIDNNIEYFNNQLQETSSQVKKTTETYHNLSKIVENKISRENETLKQYSEIVENLTQAFEEFSYTLKEELKASSQLTEEKFQEYRNQFESISSSLEKSVDKRLDDYHKELVEVKTEVAINEQHIRNVDKYLQEHHQELEELKEEVFSEIEKLPVGNLQENLERLEKKIDFIKETYSRIEPEVVVKEVIKEGLLNEPPSTNNSDPLTPLNQNFVTLEQLQQHYRLFLNRIQQQLSTLGGGGETRLKYLDDIVGIATNPSAYDGKYLKYNDSIKKFEFSVLNSDDDSWVDNSYGTYTNANVGIGTSVPQYDLDVNGDINFNGTFYQNGSPFVASRWTAGSGDDIYRLSGNVGIGTTNPTSKLTVGGDVSVTGIVTASSFSGNASSATYSTTSGISTYATTAGIATYAFISGIATYSVSSGIATSVIGGIGSLTQLNVSGVITATTFYGDGSNLLIPKYLTIGVRSGTAVTFSVSNNQFYIINKNGGNTTVNLNI